MPLDATAAAALATVLADQQDAMLLAGGLDPARVALAHASALAYYTPFFTALYASIVANAVVSPLGTPPMSNGGGAVGGTGKVL